MNPSDALKTANWPGIFTLSYRIAVILGIFGILYLKTLFITHDALFTALDPYRALPPKVQELAALSMTGADTLRDLAVWRVKKDEIDTRLITLLEGQSYMLLRQQVVLDRQQEQINAAARK